MRGRPSSLGPAALFVACKQPVSGVQHYALSLQAVPSRGADANPRPPPRRGGHAGRLRGQRSFPQCTHPPELFDHYRRPRRVTDLAAAAMTDSPATLTFTEVDDGTGAPASH